MRVAVRHIDEGHPNHHWFAFEQGRIVGFTHPISGESYTPEQVAQALLVRAQEKFPEAAGYEHRVETLHVGGHDADGKEVGEWHPVDASELPRTGQGGVVQHELEIQQDQKENDS